MYCLVLVTYLDGGTRAYGPFECGAANAIVERIETESDTLSARTVSYPEG